MTEASARFALPMLLPGQAQKELFHNEALTVIDTALHPSVAGIVSDPPGAPDVGASWIVGAAATADWADKEHSIAIWTSGGWRFITPVNGMTAWDEAAGFWRHWTGAAWSGGEWPAAAFMIEGLQVVGPRQPEIANPSGGAVIDTQARAAVEALIATLKSHGLID